MGKVKDKVLEYLEKHELAELPPDLTIADLLEDLEEDELPVVEKQEKQSVDERSVDERNEVSEEEEEC